PVTASSQITRQPKVGVGVVLRRGNRVLLGKRTGAHGAGEWALPGGKLDPGEDPATCASRELAEETGLAFAPDDFRALPLWTSDLFPEHDLHFITLYMICECPEGAEPEILEPEKCLEWRWAEWDSLPEPLFVGIDELRRR